MICRVLRQISGQHRQPKLSNQVLHSFSESSFRGLKNSTIRTSTTTTTTTTTTIHNYSKMKSTQDTPTTTIEDLTFDNRTLRELPLDPEPRNYVRQVTGAIFSRVTPLTPVSNPTLVTYSSPALGLLGLDADAEVQKRPIEFAHYFSGNELIPGAEPAAHCYAGHQFGAFSGQLGDGATMYLGEVVVQKQKKGEKNDVEPKEASSSVPSSVTRWELQFKGAGKTPYSRTADGRKVLRSSIREFLASEAHFALGIPTTRAGTVLTSDTRVTRDVFYTGHPIEERATIITRIAPTFLRFGSFEIFKARDPDTGRAGPSVGKFGLLKTLVDFTCRNYFPEIHSSSSGGGTTAVGASATDSTSSGTSSASSSSTISISITTPEESARYIAVFREIVLRTARLVASWQCFGWCHGVLNTDNMSILGLTIDYGPYGWMETFNPEFICNGSDDGGRYSYENQPKVCQWNCGKLGEAWSPLFSVESHKQEWKRIVSIEFPAEFRRAYNEGTRRKLGLGFSWPSTVNDAPLPWEEIAPLYGGSVDTANAVKKASALIRASAASSSSEAKATTMEGGAGAGGGALPSNDEQVLQQQQQQQVVSISTEDEELIQDLLDIMNATGADFTAVFRALMHVDIFGAEFPAQATNNQVSSSTSSSSSATSDPALELLMSACATAEEVAESKKPSLPLARLQMYAAMAKNNPMVAAQMESIQQEIQKHELHEILSKRTEEEKDEQDRGIWIPWLAKYRARLAVEAEIKQKKDMQGSGSTLQIAQEKLSNQDMEVFRNTRLSLMARSNPKYILRNWIAHVAIEAAEKGDFSYVTRVQNRLADPFGMQDTSPYTDEFSQDFLAASASGTTTNSIGGGGGGETLRLSEEARDASVAGAEVDKSARRSSNIAMLGGGGASMVSKCNLVVKPSWAGDLKVT